jgi:hypothetical protein
MRVGMAVIVVVVIVGHAPSPNKLTSPYAQSVALSRPQACQERRIAGRFSVDSTLPDRRRQ